MPIPYAQYNPNAFMEGADFVRQGQMQDNQLRRLYQQDQRQAAADERTKVVQGREDAQYKQETDAADRAKVLKYLPFAQSALQSGDPHAYVAAALSDPRTGQMLRQDGVFDDEDLNDPELPQHLQAFIGLAGPQKKFTQKEGPRGSVLQTDPTTGEVKQVVGPDNSQPTTAGPRAPSGYQFTPDGTLAPVPGGPADQNRPGATPPATRKDVANLRKEFEATPEVKNYRSVLPIYDRAKKAPNTRAGDISIIYALGKMFDPTSVVREGELILAKDSAPWLRKLASNAKSQMTGSGALNPETRKEIMDALDGQVDALRLPYQQQRDRYGSYASDYGADPFKIIGDDAQSAFAPKTGPKAGSVEDGYRFKGGDPKNPASWEKVR